MSPGRLLFSLDSRDIDQSEKVQKDSDRQKHSSYTDERDEREWVVPQETDPLNRQTGDDERSSPPQSGVNGI